MFQDKTVVITGASSGLGRALALQCTGARLFLAARHTDALEATRRQCLDAGAASAEAVPTDITDPEACARLLARAGEAGGIDHLVLNAGISMWAAFEDVEDLGVFRRLMEVNYLGAVYCTHHALPYLRGNKGLITSVSSIQGQIPVPLHTGYVASKHALEGFFGTLRMELEGSGVDLLIVRPHWLRGTRLRENALRADGGAMGEGRRAHSGESITLEDASTAMLRAMRQRRKELTMPPKLRALPWLKLIAPGLLHRIIRGKMGQQR